MMRKRKLIIAVVIFLLLLTVYNKEKIITMINYAHSNGKTQKVLQLETKHFKFYSEDKDKNCIKDLSDGLEVNYAKVTSDLKTVLNKKVDVYIYSDLNTFHKAINQPDAPNWVIGTSELNSNSIKMVNPSKAEDSSYVDFKKVIVHEFTHIVENKIRADENSVDIFPIWLNEGVAAFEAKQDEGVQDVLLKAKKHNKFPTLDELETDSYDFGDEDGYQFSYSIIEYIVKKYGYDKLAALIKEPYNFDNILGTSRDDFQIKWVDSIK